MNYIRGAVNAISAPYQYYRDLAPINPSTLTGAIDVIVIQRPTDNGDTELVCSPFHVRFGKWQVLRPSEKKVNLFVNGNPIPFNMKIGEAGEAFFVFETDEDVPPDLITSPILQATIPGTEENQDAIEEPVDTEYLGPKLGKEESTQPHEGEALHKLDDEHIVEPDFLDLDGRPREESTMEDVRTTPKQTYKIPKSLRKSGSRATISQASVLSLPSPPPSRDHSTERSHTPDMKEQDKRVDAALKALDAKSHVPEVDYHHDITLDMEGYKQGYHDRERSDRTIRSSSDSTSQSSPDHLEFPRHPSSSPSLKPSLSTLLSDTQSTFPVHTPYESSPPSSPSESALSSPPSSPPQPFPFRATSEPPPDLETDNDTSSILTLSAQHGHTHPQLQLGVSVEYSWEWGAFPQPSPMKASFGKGGRLELPMGLWGSGGSGSNRKSRMGFGVPKGRLGPMSVPSAMANDTDAESEETTHEQGHGRQTGRIGRSRSVPPKYLGSPARKGRRGSREYREYEDLGEHDQEDEGERGRSWNEEKVDEDVTTTRQEDSERRDETGIFGAGGTLSASHEDLTTFVLSIEGRKIAFQLSLIPPEGEEDSFSQDEAKGRQGIDNSRTKERPQDEVEAARLFDRYCVDWARFMDDETVVHDQRLVIRWAGNQYITRKDGSPLMDALVLWRHSALQKRASGDAVRPVSPPPPLSETSVKDLQRQEQHLIDERTTREDHQYHGRSKSEPPSEFERRQAEEDDKKAAMDSTGHNQGQVAVKKPTSSSWVQWWSRSRQTKVLVSGNSQVLDPARDSSTASLPLPPKQEQPLDEKSKVASSNLVKTSSAPSTPVQRAADAPRLPEQETTPTRPAAPPAEPAPSKKFAKTLRLTSDQLKSLNLRPGANAITFSLSASGAIAATARIFVWDSTDLVVISDIDGTITKSDGLGHVFAMIGRDWTHLGVAKLYTDITRNGYKIMYLTSRAIGQADATRDYLKGIKQNNYQLPEGPVIMSPDRLMASLHREVIMRKPEVFKMACLRDIQRLFGESARNPFYAGFGNRITDALSYRSVNVPSARIFTIDTTGVVKMELLELAGYKSSYIHMTDLVDQMFPPIHRKWTPEYTDFNYWKTPVQEFSLPDFSPPSPALSARSDTSNQSTLSRIRNFSLGGSAIHSRQNTIAIGKGISDGESYRNSHLRQMSSFEKLSSTLGFSSRANNGNAYHGSASPSSSSSYAGSDEEDGEEGGIGPDGQRRKRVRRRSMASMPGTLDEIHFGMDDDDEGEEDNDDHENEDSHFVHSEGEEGEEVYDGEVDDDDVVEEDTDEAFDDDLLAAGEMQKVPFL